MPFLATKEERNFASHQTKSCVGNWFLPSRPLAWGQFGLNESHRTPEIELPEFLRA